MSAKTGIEWTDSTWNPIRGVRGRHHCTKISPACTNCYAAAMNVRFSGLDYVKGADTFRLDEKVLGEPLLWTPARRIFPCSMTDLFHEDIPINFIASVFNVMVSATVNCGKRHKHQEECREGEPHTYQVLTKRASRMLQMIQAIPDYAAERFPGDSPLSIALELGDWPLRNVWLGVTAENQQYADERIPLLLQTPAALRFVSYEPVLGPVDFTRYLGAPLTSDLEEWDTHNVWGSHPERVDWIIAGGESGPRARLTNVDWLWSVLKQCRDAQVPCFMKQLGTWPYHSQNDGRHCHAFRSGAYRYERKAPGQIFYEPTSVVIKDRKGGDWNEWPKGMRVREFPKVAK